MPSTLGFAKKDVASSLERIESRTAGGMLMIQNFFADIWGTRETSYSAVIAQAIGISPVFRRFIEQKCNVVSSKHIVKLETESVLPEGYGRIDILIEYDDGMLVGIENKKWAGLQDNQLQNYRIALEKMRSQSKLIFLSPSTYSLNDKDKPRDLVKITYKEIIDNIRQSSCDNEFESTYLQYCLEYFEVMEMKPFNEQELKSLFYYNSILHKLDLVLNEVRTDKDSKIETMNSNYKLFRRTIGGFDIFIGFRFGTDWYYSTPLLMNSESDRTPECIVYIKDTWNDHEQMSKNEGIKRVHKELESAWGELGKIDYYDRKKKDECRLAIRRPLFDFLGQDGSETVRWLKTVSALIENKLS